MAEMTCGRCLRPYRAGHLCGPERGDWEAERKRDHRCTCDTCFAAHVRGVESPWRAAS